MGTFHLDVLVETVRRLAREVADAHDSVDELALACVGNDRTGVDRSTARLLERLGYAQLTIGMLKAVLRTSPRAAITNEAEAR